jgi:hypothetical protein
MKTFSAKPTDVTRKWYILDASEAPLGRLATQAAARRGQAAPPAEAPDQSGAVGAERKRTADTARPVRPSPGVPLALPPIPGIRIFLPD